MGVALPVPSFGCSVSVYPGILSEDFNSLMARIGFVLNFLDVNAMGNFRKTLPLLIL